MTAEYFSDQEAGPKARSVEEITIPFWGGLVSLIDSRVADSSFGASFPDCCQDGGGQIVGSDWHKLRLAAQGEIPGIDWPLNAQEPPPTLSALDLIQFCHHHVANPNRETRHAFFDHWHLGFYRVEGQRRFRGDVNRLFARNGLAFELRDDGTIIRLGPPVLRQLLKNTDFTTGDTTLDGLLADAVRKFLSPDFRIRREAVEKLWDAWERAKTLENPADKKQSAEALLNKAVREPKLRDVINTECRALTQIGNDFQIRHFEVAKTPITDTEQLDYLFHRLFSLVWLLLKATGRCR